jgi:hypothetical protein
MEEERKAGNILTVLDSLDGGISCKEKIDSKTNINTTVFLNRDKNSPCRNFS